MQKLNFVIIIFLLAVLFNAGGECQVADLSGKKILMVVASDGYRDEEFEEPMGVFKKSKAQVTIASSTLGKAKGVKGGSVKPDILLGSAKAGDYDAIVFVGGMGAQEYFSNAKAIGLAKELYAQKKIVAAICIAPVILANAGLLNGRKATVTPSSGRTLVLEGAIYTAKAVEEDGNIITADGPASATKFAERIVEKLSKK